MSSSAATSAQVANGLVIISGLLYGTRMQAANEDLVKEVVRHLIGVNLWFSHHESIQHQTLAVLTNLLKVQGSGSDFKQGVIDVEARVAHAVGFSSASKLYESQADQLLKLVTAEHESWSTDSYGQALFQVLLQKINILVSFDAALKSTTAGPYLEGLLPVLKGYLDQERDPRLRIKLLQLLDELFEVSELAPFWSSLATVVLGEILVPCGVWRVGKVGAAIRHAAMVAFGTFLTRNLCNQSDLEILLQSDQVLPVLLSCLEEDYFVDIRIVTCHVLDHVLRTCGRSLNEIQREEVRKCLQNRLDDSNDDVRLRVLPAISTFFCTMPSSYSETSVRSFVTGILVHMDDTNTEIRESVYKALEVCTSLRPAIVKDLVKSNCDQHQMQEYCEYLLAKAAGFQNNEAVNA